MGQSTSPGGVCVPGACVCVCAGARVCVCVCVCGRTCVYVSTSTSTSILPRASASRASDVINMVKSSVFTV